MPDYKSHSIHSEIVLKNINKRTFIEPNNLKKFAIGPDLLMFTNYRLFDYQHSHNTKLYFESLIKTIKERKLQDNSRVMEFLYGQIDHFILDTIIHPLIYYMTEKMPSKSILKPHTLIELWIADYLMLKYNIGKKKYYGDSIKFDIELNSLISDVYNKSYNEKNIAKGYRIGMYFIDRIEYLRTTSNHLVKSICKTINLGNFSYGDNHKKVKKYLNLNHSKLLNPVNGKEFYDSFDDLWSKSLMISLELIEDVNNYLYLDKSLNNYYIENDISYNTGLPCTNKEVFKYVKRY